MTLLLRVGPPQRTFPLLAFPLILGSAGVYVPAGCTSSIPPLKLNGCMKVTVLLVVRTVMGDLDPSMKAFLPKQTLGSPGGAAPAPLRSSPLITLRLRPRSTSAIARLQVAF
jgi:hypothetical protein